jgi:hypothetical protein
LQQYHAEGAAAPHPPLTMTPVSMKHTSTLAALLRVGHTFGALMRVCSKQWQHASLTAAAVLRPKPACSCQQAHCPLLFMRREVARPARGLQQDAGGGEVPAGAAAAHGSGPGGIAATWLGSIPTRHQPRLGSDPHHAPLQASLIQRIIWEGLWRSVPRLEVRVVHAAPSIQLHSSVNLRKYDSCSRRGHLGCYTLWGA